MKSCTILDDVVVFRVQDDFAAGVLLDANGRRCWEADQRLLEGVACELGPVLQIELVTCSRVMRLILMTHPSSAKGAEGKEAKGNRAQCISRVHISGAAPLLWAHRN